MTTKNIITAKLLLATIFLNIATAKAQSRLKYNKSANALIGITPVDAAGSMYEIKNESGKVVIKGKITENKIFYIATKYLFAGSYNFTINGTVLQEFEIN